MAPTMLALTTTISSTITSMLSTTTTTATNFTATTSTMLALCKIMQIVNRNPILRILTN